MVTFLFSAVLFVVVRSQINAMTDYTCTDDAHCLGLRAYIDLVAGATASQIVIKCNTDDYLCSIDCSGFDFCTVNGIDTMVGVPSGVLSCDAGTGKHWCEADLSCTGDTDCTGFTGLTQCSQTRCIPGTATPCTDDAGCLTPGMDSCNAAMRNGVTVKWCGVKPCSTSTECTTTGFTMCDTVTSGIALADGSYKGVCVPPTNPPSSSPSGNPSAMSAAPSASPSMSPSTNPSASPSTMTAAPSGNPSVSPSMSPSKTPSASPSMSPSKNPSASPSDSPVTTTATPTTSPEDGDDESLDQGAANKTCGVFGTLIAICIAYWM